MAFLRPQQIFQVNLKRVFNPKNVNSFFSIWYFDTNFRKKSASANNLREKYFRLNDDYGTLLLPQKKCESISADLNGCLPNFGMYLQLVSFWEHLRSSSAESNQNRKTKTSDVKPPADRLIFERMGTQDRQVGGTNKAPAEGHQAHCMKEYGNCTTSLK